MYRFGTQCKSSIRNSVENVSSRSTKRSGIKTRHTINCTLKKMALSAAAKRLIPMFDRVLVLRAEAVTKTKGGIVIPEKSQGKVLHGTVVAVGPGSRNSSGELVPPSVQVGDKVLLPEYGGTRVELEENKEYHLFRETDILAKLE